MMTNATTYTVNNRTEFANLVRAYRAIGALRAYGRLGRFGRSIITNDFTVVFPAWTERPPMNIHR